MLVSLIDADTPTTTNRHIADRAEVEITGLSGLASTEHHLEIENGRLACAGERNVAARSRGHDAITENVAAPLILDVALT